MAKLYKKRTSIEMLESFESIFHTVVHAGILFFEVAGVGILIATGIYSVFLMLFSHKHIRMTLAQGIALALEFKMGGEVLRTVIVREWSELVILGAIILLRGSLTYLIHWEMRHIEPQNKTRRG